MAGTAKAFCLSFDYVLYDMSYANIILYGATLPSYRNGKKKDEESIRADDPKNTDKLKAMIETMK